MSSPRTPVEDTARHNSAVESQSHKISVAARQLRQNFWILP